MTEIPQELHHSCFTFALHNTVPSAKSLTDMNSLAFTPIKTKFQVEPFACLRDVMILTLVNVCTKKKHFYPVFHYTECVIHVEVRLDDHFE